MELKKLSIMTLDTCLIDMQSDIDC